jgi:tRNA A37 methylthiotransferase MiaB
MTKQAIFIYDVSTCNRRKLDCQRLYEYFWKNHYPIVTNPVEADVILLVTCAYSTKHAELSLQAVKRFSKYRAEVVVIGCLPAIEPEQLRNIFNGKIVSTEHLNRIQELFPGNIVNFEEMTDAHSPWQNIFEFETISALKRTFPTGTLPDKIKSKIGLNFQSLLLQSKSTNCKNNLAKFLLAKRIKEKLNLPLQLHNEAFFIRTSWGCLGNCSYCVIKKAIGPLRSKPIKDVISDFETGLRLHYTNFIFDADDIGSYGLDIGTTFPVLLQNILTIKGDYKIHIRNIHPTWVVTYVESLKSMVQSGKIQGIGCSIQSGNPRILRLMHRYPDTEKVKTTLQDLQQSCPNLVLATECINGFPTETFEEFQDTLQFLNEVNFSLGYIFPFSSRPGTPAERLEPKIKIDEIKARMTYADQYLRKNGYENIILKKHNILLFSKNSPTFSLTDSSKSFCLATID